MKTSSSRVVLLVLIAALVVIVSVVFKSRPTRAAVVEKSKAARAVQAAGNAAAVPVATRKPAVAVPAPGTFWRLGNEPAGDADGLGLQQAAASRGAEILPAGKRFRIDAFPDLRSLKEGDKIDVSLPDGRVFKGNVNWSAADQGYADTYQVSIGFAGSHGGVVATDDGTTGRIAGRVMVEHDRLAWTIDTEKDGSLWLVEHLREDLVCELPAIQGAARSAPLPGDPGVTGSGSVAPSLNSKTTASAVLYLDFDGQPTQKYPDWPSSNPGGVNIVVPHSGMTADQMTLVWRRVVEDFIQFNINVTTDVAKYNAAAVGSRMRILIGNTLTSGVNGAGLAFVRSFRSNASTGFSLASNVPCWLEVSPNYGNPTTMTDGQFSSLASNTSHELGHTLGLWHDGNDGSQPSDANGGNYYPGHGTQPFDWGAIMGSPYRSGSTALGIIQWAKKDYPGANNSQDDLAIISGTANGFGYVPDESTGGNNASTLTSTGTNQVGGQGIIANAADLDWWTFQVTRPGSVSVTVEPADTAVSLPDLDCGFRIENAAGTTVAGGFATQDNLAVTAAVNLTAGTYRVVAYGTGNRQFSDSTGYNDYGSTGRYLVTVDLPPDTTPPQVAIVSPANGSVLSNPTLQFNGTASDDDYVSGLSIYLRRESDQAWWNGSYWQIGSSGAALARSYDGNTHQWACTASLPQVGGSSPGSLGGGNFTFIAIAEDPAGHSVQVDSTVTVSADGPSVSIAGPVSGSTIGAPGWTFNGVVGTSGGINGLPLYIRRNADGYYWNGSAWQTSATGASLGSQLTPVGGTSTSLWSCTSSLPVLGSTFLPGSYNFIAIAVDGLGYTRQIDSVIQVDGTKPVTAISAPASGAVLTAGSVAFQGTVTDNGGVQRVVAFIRRQSDDFYWNGGTWISDPLSANLSTSYNSAANTWVCNATLPVPGSSLANGSYDFIAIGFDYAGNTQQSDSFVTVDFHQTYHWTAGSFSDGVVGNEDYYWGNPANWSPAGVPGSADIAYIDLDQTVRSTISRTVFGFYMSAGSLDFDNAGDSLTITKTGTWTGGNLEDTVFISPSAVFGISGPNIKQIGSGGSIRNSGAVTWTGPGLIRGYQGSGWINKSGSSFAMAGDGDVFANYYPGNTFTNEAGATFVKSAGDPAASTFIDEWTIFNNGKIDCQQGTLQFSTTLNLQPGSNLAGSGRVLFNGTVNLTTLLASTGNPELNGDFNGNSTDAGFSGSQPFVWSGGTIGGTFDLKAGSVLNLTTDSVKQLGSSADFTNHGRVVWQVGLLRGYQSSVFDNESGGIFEATNDGDVFANYYPGNVFNNKAGALFLKSGKSGVPDSDTLVDEWTFNNAGTIRSDDGTLRFNTQLNLASGTSISRSGIQSARVISSYNFTLTGTTTVNNTTFGTSGDWAGNVEDGTAGNGTIATTGGGVFEWSGGTSQNTVTLAANSDFRITGSAIKQIGNGGVINALGITNWSGDGELRGYQSSTFRNLAGAVFTVATDADFTNYYAGNRFSNAAGATFRKTGGSADTVCGWAFDNAGSALATTGSFAINAGGTSSGTFAPSAGAEIRFQGGQSDLTAGATLTGTGIVSVNGGTVNAVDSVTSDLTAGSLAISGGIVTSAAPASFGVVGNVGWIGGTIAGIFNVAAGSVFTLDGPSIKEIGSGGVINNSGAATWNPPGLLRGYQTSTWNNKSGGTFTMTGDGDVLAGYYGGNTFNNEAGAKFIKTAGETGDASSYIDEWTFNNAGDIDSRQGTLYFNTTLNLNAGSNLLGNGRVLLSGTTNLAAALTSTGNPELAGTLNGTDPAAGLSGTHPLNWSSGEINGTFILQAGSVLELTTAAIKQIGSGSSITSYGRVNWREGLLRGYQTSTFNNEAGAVFDATTDGDIFGNAYGGNVFNNKAGATFVKSGRSADPAGFTYVDEWIFNNAGMARTDDGLLRFNTELNLLPGGKIARTGTLPARVLSSYFCVLTGTTTVDNVTFETSGDWNGNLAEGTAGNGTLATANGGIFEWTGGTANNTVNIAPGSSFAISGDAVKQIGNGGVLNNGGVATRTGTGALLGYQSSTFANLAGAVFNIATDAPFTNAYSGNRLTNAGTLNIGAGAGISPLNWSFAQTAGGRLNLKIGGTDAVAPQFDQLKISGSADLAGTVAVSLINGYVPVGGTTFPVMTFASAAGTFGAVQGSGAIWGGQYHPNDFTLVAKTYPTTKAEWAGYFFTDPNSADAQMSADPDHDGLPNLVEYALGRDPHVGGSSGITAGKMVVGPNTYLTLSYTRPAGEAALTDMAYTGERSGTLLANGWLAAGVVVQTVAPGPGPAMETVTLRSTQPVAGNARDFLHLKLEAGE